MTGVAPFFNIGVLPRKAEMLRTEKVQFQSWGTVAVIDGITYRVVGSSFLKGTRHLMHPFSVLTLGIFIAGYITARWDLVTRLYELAIFAADHGVVVSSVTSGDNTLGL